MQGRGGEEDWRREEEQTFALPMEAKVPARPRARFQRVPRATDGDSAARPDLDAPIVTARSLFSGAIRRALGAICLTSECDRSGAIDHRSDGFALAVTSVWDTGMARGEQAGPGGNATSRIRGDEAMSELVRAVGRGCRRRGGDSVACDIRRGNASSS